MEFGKLKSKILATLVNSYENKNFDNIKKIINLINENKDFKEMFIFYDEFESLQLNENVNEYLSSVESLLIDKRKKIKDSVKDFESVLNEIEFEYDDLYKNLDILSEDKTLLNVDKKINSINFLSKHLMTEKENDENVSINENFSENYLSIYLETFNKTYDNLLNEEEKEILVNILNSDVNQLKENYNNLKVDVNKKLNNLLQENYNNNELKEKLLLVKNGLDTEKFNKYNYLKLINLNNEI